MTDDWFEVGGQVVCLNDKWAGRIPYLVDLPCPLVKGGVYTVTSINKIEGDNCKSPLGVGSLIMNSTTLELADVENPYDVLSPPSTGFCSSRFRPLKSNSKDNTVTRSKELEYS